LTRRAYASSSAAFSGKKSIGYEGQKPKTQQEKIRSDKVMTAILHIRTFVRFMVLSIDAGGLTVKAGIKKPRLT
jgi:hypothetical protein